MHVMALTKLVLQWYMKRWRDLLDGCSAFSRILHVTRTQCMARRKKSEIVSGCSCTGAAEDVSYIKNKSYVRGHNLTGDGHRSCVCNATISKNIQVAAGYAGRQQRARI